MPERFTDTVKRALVHSITSIGQLSNVQTRELEYAVKQGWLSKGKGGPFPAIKTVYARPGFDFAGEREREWQLINSFPS